MNVKRYQAPTAREALRALKAELGADAIVLSNRAIDGGVEILALPAEAVGTIQPAARRPEREPVTPPPVAERAAPPARPRVSEDDDELDDDYTVSLSARAPAADGGRPPRVISPFTPPRYETADYLMRNRTSSVQIAPEPVAAMPEVPLQRPVAPRPQTQTESYAPPPQTSTRTRAKTRAPLDHHPDDIDGLAELPPAASQHVSPARKSPAEEERMARLQADNARLMAELSGIRGMIERQLAGFAWGETRRTSPVKAELLGELLSAGFSAPLARELLEAVPDDQDTPEAAREAVRAALARNLRAMCCDADLIDRGGVYALVGPTGVGKTTTTAKIAARCVVRHGADKLALITTDGYRIGAQEQLRIYGRILGVPVFPVRDGADLRQTLSELRDKHMVLIDTVGMSQRDRLVAQQAAMLLGAGPVRRVLLLNATARGDTLDDVIRAYGGSELAGCILSKVDEAASLAPAIGAAIKHSLELLYVTNGQRVPEDLHLPNRSYLLHRALRGVPDDSAWRMQADEAGLMLAAGSASVSGFGGYGHDRCA